jgi:glycerol-3-phosphate acyltransferase PlsY
MDTLTIQILCTLGGYLLGSIPFGLLLTKAAGLGDVRNIGSGNIGATNVLRTGNKGLALATLLFDGGKGALAVFLAYAFVPEGVLFAAGGAFLGHLYPVWLKFQGGKGVATFLGIALAINLVLGVICCAAWLVTALLFRWSSLASLTAGAVSPIAAYFIAGGWPPTILFAVLAALIFLRHRANIGRLLSGEEPKIGQK